MTYSELLSLFSCELPSYYQPHWESFLSQYKPGEPLLSEEELSGLQKATEVPDACIAMTRDVQSAILKDANLHMAAAFYLYVTVIRRMPWQNELYTETVLPVPGFACESVNLFFVSFALSYTLTVRKPPLEKNQTNLDAYRGYSHGCFEQKGYWGINEFNWNMQCAGGCMFMCGALKFCPSDFTNDFPILTNGKEYVSTVGGSYGINQYGELTNDESEIVAKTVFEETETAITANRVLKNGTTCLQPETFLKSEWKDFLRGGSPTIDIHIPPHMDYRPEVLREAYLEALDFYKGYFPNHHIRAIAGYSWIFAPQLGLILPEDSNIMAVQRTMHIMQTTGTYGSDIRFVRPGSSLQKKIADKEAEGRKFHYSVMYIPVDEI